MKKEARLLLGKSVDSLLLSVEHFNRPWNRGREEAVLILLDRAFELLLKAAIVHQNGKIRERGEKETFGFDKCVRKCLSNEAVKCLTEDQALTIQIINSLRDAAQHYILDISEQQLYMYAQAGITLYDELLRDVFAQGLEEYLPERVLPVSTKPPSDLVAVFEAEFKEITLLVTPGSRKMLQARAKIRPIAIVEASLRGERSQPSPGELNRVVKEIQKGKGWRELFPGIAGLRLDTSGTGLTISLRLTRKEGEPVHLVPEGTPGATVVAIKRVNELGFYNLGLYQLAEQVGLSRPKTLAVVCELGLQDDPDCFKIIKIGKSVYKRYSQRATQKINKGLPNLDLDEVWERHKPGRKGKSAEYGGSKSLQSFDH